MTELGAYTTTGSWRLGGSIGALFLPFGGPDFTRGALTESAACPTNLSPGCAKDSTAIASERAWGPLGMLVPQVFAGYEL